MKRLIALLVFFSHFNCFSGSDDQLVIRFFDCEKGLGRAYWLGINNNQRLTNWLSPESFFKNHLLKEKANKKNLSISSITTNTNYKPSLFKLYGLLAGLTAAKVTGIKIGAKTQSALGALLLGDFIYQTYNYITQPSQATTEKLTNSYDENAEYSKLELGFFHAMYNMNSENNTQSEYTQGKNVYEKIKNGQYSMDASNSTLRQNLAERYLNWLKNPTEHLSDRNLPNYLHLKGRVAIEKEVDACIETLTQEYQRSFAEKMAANEKENTAMLKNNALKLVGIGLGIATLNTTHLWAPPLTSLILKTGSLTQKSLQAACSGMYNGCKTVGNGILNTIAN